MEEKEKQAPPNETILVKAYDFIKYSLPILNKMPREQRYLLGHRLQEMLSDLLERIVEAYYAPTHHKRELLTKVNLSLEKLRYFFRLGYDLGYYNSIRYHDFALRINEIGKMTGGWLKSLK
jgi:hypothetical protein